MREVGTSQDDPLWCKGAASLLLAWSLLCCSSSLLRSSCGYKGVSSVDIGPSSAGRVQHELLPLRPAKMGFADVGQGIASVIFLVLFLALGLAVAFCIATRRPLRRFVGLSIFTAIRIGSQIAGIGFACASYSNFH